MIPPPGSAEVLPPARTVVARLYLPMEMGAFARICKAVAREFPGAVLSEPDVDGEVVIATGREP